MRNITSQAKIYPPIVEINLYKSRALFGRMVPQNPLYIELAWFINGAWYGMAWIVSGNNQKKARRWRA
jgi:hypothetical protein